MLNSAVLRRTIAVLGIGAASVSPALPFAAIALFGASVPTTKVNAGVLPAIDDPIIDPEDVEDGTGGFGDPIFPPFPFPFPDLPPEDVEDGTGGIDGSLP